MVPGVIVVEGMNVVTAGVIVDGMVCIVVVGIDDGVGIRVRAC